MGTPNTRSLALEILFSIVSSDNLKRESNSGFDLIMSETNSLALNASGPYLLLVLCWWILNQTPEPLCGTLVSSRLGLNSHRPALFQLFLFSISIVNFFSEKIREKRTGYEKKLEASGKNCQRVFAQLVKTHSLSSTRAQLGQKGSTRGCELGLTKKTISLKSTSESDPGVA